MEINKCDSFSAEIFVENLKREGSKVSLTEARFTERDEIPPFYNENIFKRGQSFFRKYQGAILFANLYGLLSLLSDPDVVKILETTKRSSKPETAYRRYMKTILHVTTWYKDEFRPGSRLWKSIRSVNMQHTAVTNCAGNLGLVGINQCQLAGALFGFMGFMVIRPEEIGIYNATDDELEAFIHLWRVIGYAIGVEDRFNLCRESVKETKEICEAYLGTVLKPLLLMKYPRCLQLQLIFLKAFNIIIPNLSSGVWFNFLYKLARLPDGAYLKLPLLQRLSLQYYTFFLSLLQYKLVRVLYNLCTRLLLWMIVFHLVFARFKLGKMYAPLRN